MAGEDFLTFDEWVKAEYRASVGFTALIVLMKIDSIRVTPLRSTFLHVIGDEIDWPTMADLFSRAGTEWDAAVFVPVTPKEGGPVDDATAKVRLRALEAEIDDDRLAINNGHFFDKWGRRMTIEEMDLPQ